MISIIIPVFQAERSLRYCLESIIAQTYTNFEAILVNDGSSDRSGEICNHYAENDRRIKVIHKANGGVSSARNAGIHAASGEYIVFCDSDDYLEPDYLEKLYEITQQYPEYDSIWCNYNTVSSYSVTKSACSDYDIDTIEISSVKYYMSLSERILTNQPWNKIFKTEIINETGISFPESMSLGEDLLFNLAYIDASGNDAIAIIKKPLYDYYFSNQNSLNNKYRPDLLQIYRLLNMELFNHLTEWNADKNEMEKYYNSCFYCYENVLDNTMRNPTLDRKEKIKQNSSLLKSKEFKNALQNSSCKLNVLLRKAYESENYRYVKLFNELHRVKQFFLSLLRQKRMWLAIDEKN